MKVLRTGVLWFLLNTIMEGEAADSAKAKELREEFLCIQSKEEHGNFSETLLGQGTVSLDCEALASRFSGIPRYSGAACELYAYIRRGQGGC